MAQELAQRWLIAKKHKNYELADDLREELRALGADPSALGNLAVQAAKADGQCADFTRTGTCAFGAKCKFHHYSAGERRTLRDVGKQLRDATGIE